jgi:hypothetical protein
LEDIERIYQKKMTLFKLNGNGDYEKLIKELTGEKIRKEMHSLGRGRVEARLI